MWRWLVATRLLAASTAFSCPGATMLRCSALSSSRLCSAVVASGDETVAEPAPAAWFEDAAAEESSDLAATPEATPVKSGAPAGPAMTDLQMSDLTNTKWKLRTTNRPDGWLPGEGQDQEVTLLDDGSVVWGGAAGGFGTGGRWQLQDTILEVIRTTPLGLVTGRDYYMMNSKASVTDNLQFELKGIIRSYNALYPVAVVADFVAVRQPGRFIRNDDDDEE
jgi:hypothetical protein